MRREKNSRRTNLTRATRRLLLSMCAFVIVIRLLSTYAGSHWQLNSLLYMIFIPLFETSLYCWCISFGHMFTSLAMAQRFVFTLFTSLCILFKLDWIFAVIFIILPPIFMIFRMVCYHWARFVFLLCLSYTLILSPSLTLKSRWFLFPFIRFHCSQIMCTLLIVCAW